MSLTPQSFWNLNDCIETQSKTQELKRRPGENCASKPEGRRQARAPTPELGTADPGPRGPILRGPTHQELKHDAGGEGEEGVKGASAPALLPDSSPARGRNPPPGSGLRPAPPCLALSFPEATRGAAAPSDGLLGKQDGEAQTQASWNQSLP